MDKKITICCLLILLFVPFISKAQYEEEEVPVHFSDTTWYDKGYVEKVEGGRVITPAGRSFLDKKSGEIIKDIPSLEKY